MIKINSFARLIGTFGVFITLMIVCRVGYSGSLGYVFLLWNLFLAWIPFQLSSMLFKDNLPKWKTNLLLAGWLLFFPNALYIITDLIHLKDDHQTAPIWFDAILLFTSSITGLMIAFGSLLQIERFLQKNIRVAVVDRLVVGCIFLGSFGVYVGRFLRWNSWDIIANPIRLVSQIVAPFILPTRYFRTWGVTLLLTCLFSLLYFSIKKLPGLLKEPGNKILY